MNGYEKPVKDKLKEHGWCFHEHGKGSHDTWIKGADKVTVSKVCKSRHTANAIMKDAGINHKF